MSQCNTLTPAQFLIANNGSNMIDFLSGKATNEGTAFRDRSEQDQATGAFVQTVLGDIINASRWPSGLHFSRTRTSPTM